MHLSGKSSSWLYTFGFTCNTLSLNKFSFSCNYIHKQLWVPSFQFLKEVGLTYDIYMVVHVC